MFARITHYRMKPDMVADATAKLEQMKPQVMALPGIKHFINAVNDDGTGCVISIVDSREVSDANDGAVQQLWSQFADHLAEPPEASGFEITAHWSI